MRFSTAFIIAAAASIAGPARAQQLRVKVDSTAEILAIMFRVSGAPEYSMGRIQPYMRQVDSAFKPFADHPTLREIRRLRIANGVRVLPSSVETRQEACVDKICQDHRVLLLTQAG